MFENQCYATTPSSSNGGESDFERDDGPDSPTSRLLMEYEEHLRNTLEKGMDAESYSLHTFEALLTQSMENLESEMKSLGMLPHSPIKSRKSEKERAHTLDRVPPRTGLGPGQQRPMIGRPQSVNSSFDSPPRIPLVGRAETAASTGIPVLILGGPALTLATTATGTIHGTKAETENGAGRSEDTSVTTLRGVNLPRTTVKTASGRDMSVTTSPAAATKEEEWSPLSQCHAVQTSFILRPPLRACSPVTPASVTSPLQRFLTTTGCL
jgi:hypothetical protein